MFTKILSAFKFSNAGITAYQKAVQLARHHQARLFVFHALSYRLTGIDPGHAEVVAQQAAAEMRFKTEIKPLVELEQPIRFVCMPADPAMAVCKMARELMVDLIVLGCHQPLEKAGLGRVDYVGMTILEKAPCPVMLIPYVG
jgi:nucleotide-binding universal stress UspA family protein